MIVDTKTKKLRRAISSDHWHVVHAQWGTPEGKSARFARTIVSEHDGRAAAVKAARTLSLNLQPRMSGRRLPERDQIFVRAPGFKSVKFTHRRR